MQTSNRRVRIVLLIGALTFSSLALRAFGIPNPVTGTHFLEVHGVNQTALPLGAFPGALPVVDQRYVGCCHGAWEPPLAFANDGSAIFDSAVLNGTSGRDNFLYRTTNEGLTWQNVTPTVGGSTLPLNLGADPILNSDPVTGRMYRVLYDVCALVSFSDDNGATWNTPHPICNDSGTDHPTLFTGTAPPETRSIYPQAVYLCYDGIGGME